MDYLLDTNIVLTYLRNNETTKALEETLHLFSETNRLIISVVSVGELMAIAKKNSWGLRKIHQLNRLIEDFLIADINVSAILEEYALIDAFSQGKLGSGKK